MFDGQSNDALPLCCTTRSRSGTAAGPGCDMAGGTSELRAGSGWLEEPAFRTSWVTQRGTACDLSSAVSPIRPETPHYCRRWNSQFFAYEAPMHSYYYMFKQQTWNPASLRMTNKRSRCLSNGRIFLIYLISTMSAQLRGHVVRKPCHRSCPSFTTDGSLLPIQTCKVNLLYARVAGQIPEVVDIQRHTTNTSPLEPGEPASRNRARQPHEAFSGLAKR